MSQKPVPRAWVDWCWLVLRRAAARHGKHWREPLSDARAKLIQAALRQAKPHEIARAVDGYMAATAHWSEEVRHAKLTPEYVLRATLLDQHIEAAPLGWDAMPAPSKPTTQPVVPVEQEIREAAELRALGFLGTVGSWRVK